MKKTTKYVIYSCLILMVGIFAGYIIDNMQSLSISNSNVKINVFSFKTKNINVPYSFIDYQKAEDFKLAMKTEKYGWSIYSCLNDKYDDEPSYGKAFYQRSGNFKQVYILFSPSKVTSSSYVYFARAMIYNDEALKLDYVVRVKNSDLPSLILTQQMNIYSGTMSSNSKVFNLYPENACSVVKDIMSIYWDQDNTPLG